MPRNRAIPMLLAALALVGPVSAAAGAWTTGGPNAPSNAFLAMAPSDSSVLYLAAGDSGLFGTRDAGATWTALLNPLPGGSVTSIAVHPTSSTTVYALVSGHLFRSADGGSTWSALQSDHSDVIAVSIDASHASTLYTSTYGAVYRSTDDGANWTATGHLTFPGTRPSVWHVFFHATRPSTLWATVNPDPRDTDSGSQLWGSDDGGSTWSRLGSFGGYDGPSVASVVVDLNAPETLYVTTNGGLFRSADGGRAWTSLGAGLDVSLSSVLLIDPTDSSRLFVSQNGSGIYKSTDGGTTWAPFGVGLPKARVSSFAVSAKPSGTVYAGTKDGVFKSADSGATWASASAGVIGSDILTVAIDRADRAHVYAGTDHGIYSTTDGGRSWKAIGLSNAPVQKVVVDPRTTSNVFAATAFGDQSGLYKSADGGQTWAEVAAWGWVNALAIDSNNPSNLYVSDAISSRLYKSTDGAASWAPTTFDRILTSIAIDPANSSVIYGANDYFDFPDIFVKSTDGGFSWSSSGSGLPDSVSTISIDPTNGSVLYAGTPDGVYKSTNAAATWTRMGSSLTGKHVPAIAIDPHDPATLYAAADQDGVYRSTDGGATWQVFNDGLTNLAVSSLAIDPTGSILHAGTVGGGVFEAPLEAVAVEPCTLGAETLCLLGNRFKVTVAVRDSHGGRTSPARAVPQVDRFGYFSFPGFTGDPELPEVVVKMVDATAPPWNAFWFFYSGMTSLPYVVTVTDTSTGAARSYSSDGFCGEADIHAFPGGGVGAIATAPSARDAAALSVSGTSLSLLSGRYRITLTASDPGTNRSTEGTAIAGGDRFGYFSLPDFMGDPRFPEVFVKMIDASSFSGGIWLFHTGLTNLPYSLRVEDTTTGTVHTFENAHGGTSQLCGADDTSTLWPPVPDVSGTWAGEERDRGATDDYFCPSRPNPVSIEITQSDYHVTFQMPLGHCADGGTVQFDGTLGLRIGSLELAGSIRREASGTACALSGYVSGTVEGPSLTLEGLLGGSCNALGTRKHLAAMVPATTESFWDRVAVTAFEFRLGSPHGNHQSGSRYRTVPCQFPLRSGADGVGTGVGVAGRGVLDGAGVAVDGADVGVPGAGVEVRATGVAVESGPVSVSEFLQLRSPRGSSDARLPRTSRI